MRLVIYDDADFEPITVITVPGFGERDIERYGRKLRLAVPDDIHEMISRREPPSQAVLKTVDIEFEVLVRKGLRRWIAFTRAPELAMLIEPAFLPGQRDYVETIRKQRDTLAQMIVAAIGG